MLLRKLFLYAKIRLQDNFLEKEVLFMSNDIRDAVKNIDGMEEISLSDIDISCMFFSGAGDYTDQPLNEIIQEKFEECRKNGFCLWNVGSRAFDAVVTRPLCIEKKTPEKILTFCLHMFRVKNRPKEVCH